MQKTTVLMLSKSGMSPSQIQKATKLGDKAIYKYLREGGIDARTFEEKQRDEKVEYTGKLSHTGKTPTQIAQEMGITLSQANTYLQMYTSLHKTKAVRAEEMRLSWQGMPTTQIMGTMGRNRGKVLNDQHITADYLRNNADALEYVAARNGDVSEHFKDSEKTEVLEREI